MNKKLEMNEGKKKCLKNSLKCSSGEKEKKKKKLGVIFNFQGNDLW